MDRSVELLMVLLDASACVIITATFFSLFCLRISNGDVLL